MTTPVSPPITTWIWIRYPAPVPALPYVSMQPTVGPSGVRKIALMKSTCCGFRFPLPNCILSDAWHNVHLKSSLFHPPEAAIYVFTSKVGQLICPERFMEVS
eukprot:768590-Hanusia_phi.AAC.5